MGVLDEVKRKAEVVQKQDEAASNDQANLQQVYADEIRPRLVKIHGYLLDLIEQLEIAKWKVEASYYFPGIGLVEGLEQTDYKVVIDSTDAPKEVLLTLNCQLPEPRRFIVAQQDANALREFLFTQGATYTTRPYSSPDGTRQLQFESQLQIKAHALFKADVESSGIKVQICNFEEDSVVNLDIGYAEIDDERLDRMGNFVLRRINDFSKRHKLTESEHEALRASLKDARLRERHGLPRLTKKEREPTAVDANGLLTRLREKLFGARTKK